MRRTLLLVPLLLVACGGADRAGLGAPSPSASAAVAEGCPEQFSSAGTEPWVPAEPTTETPGRLVPDADPVEALLCRYDEADELVGQVVLTEGLNGLRHDLLVPEELDGREQVCTLIGGGRVPHLMRLTYADGDLWVSAVQDPNSCTNTGNGDFVSSAYLGDRLATAYDGRSWPATPQVDGCTGGTGRLGQEGALVPEGWQSLVVCTGGSEPREVEPEQAQQVTSVLAEVDAGPGTNGCSGPARATYSLLFRYEVGPPVQVRHSPGCEPALSNGSLGGTTSQQQEARLEDLLAPS